MSSSPITSVPKGRKGSAAGGGKAWTEEEEVYLLQMRLQKVAYKKIATHLDKTELACRLHYHQLSHGGNRRKRNNSMSSNSSDKSATSPVQTPVGASLDSNRQRSPTPSRLSPVSPNGSIQKLAASTPSKIKGKPLLPKPADGSTPRKQTPAKSKQLRVNCNAESVDKEKLARIVEAQKTQFWNTVAAVYGGSFSPEYLEQYWSKGILSGPPTPATSPQSKASSPVATGIAEEPEPSNIMDVMKDATPGLTTGTPIATVATEMPPVTEKMLVEPSSETQKAAPSEPSADVTMNDVPEVGESEAHWTE